MALDKKDLEAIRYIVKDTVEFAIEKSEIKMGSRIDKLDKRLTLFEERITNKIETEVSDLAAMNREFLAKIDDHETRIQKLETEALA